MKKTTKKLAALFLAMVMAFSLMAVTAAAYGEDEHVHTDACSEETIQPRGQKIRCSLCGGDAEIVTEVRTDGTYKKIACHNCPGTDWVKVS